MRRTYAVKCYNRRQQKTRAAGAGNAERPSDGTPVVTRSPLMPIVYVSPPPVVPIETTCCALLPIEVGCL